jgi:hypothetical protein
MGQKISRSHFEADEVLFVGYSKRNEAFCSSVADAFGKGFHRLHAFFAGVRG